MQRITPCLWFDDKAEDAARFYTSIVPDSKIVTVTHYGSAGPRPKGTVMTVVFQLNGQEFMALNGGPEFTFSPAVSFVIKCETQAEIDRCWDKLSADKSREQCGWVQDKFGVSWQIVPAILDRLVGDSDPVKADRVMAAIMKMKKLDIAELKRAHGG
ncbi:MAG TPA: VOC family protein [Kofleriaceae bacterium]|nr:VOC family protein [Kofleriaceae bacterium]HMG57932.1 VOC family protein [Kofleriaceae bacterium]